MLPKELRVQLVECRRHIFPFVNLSSQPPAIERLERFAHLSGNGGKWCTALGGVKEGDERLRCEGRSQKLTHAARRKQTYTHTQAVVPLTHGHR
jgi:hypothetical protein